MMPRPKETAAEIAGRYGAPLKPGAKLTICPPCLHTPETVLPVGWQAKAAIGRKKAVDPAAKAKAAGDDRYRRFLALADGTRTRAEVAGILAVTPSRITAYCRRARVEGKQFRLTTKAARSTT